MKSKRFLIGVFVSVLSVITLFTSCTSTKNIYVDNGGETKADFVASTSESIVKQGATDYVIVYENSDDSNLLTAVSELQDFFKEATGISLTALKDNETTSKTKKYLSLGATSSAKLALGSTGEELGVSDYRVAFEGNNAYVLGGSGSGVLWGTYKLLNIFFGYKFYKEGNYTLNTNVKNLPLYTGDKTYKAAIALRADYSGMNLYGSTISSSRLGLMTDDKLSVGGRHNSLEMLDFSTYGDSHPYWYSSSGDQLCYTAHGDEKELDAMIEVASEKITSLFLQSGAENKTYARFQMMDNKNWCACSACQQKKESCGAQSAAMLETCNKIGERVTQKLNALGDNRKVSIVPLLYNETEDVPVKLNQSTGEYELSENMEKLEFVTPLWACMSMKDHAKSWSDTVNTAALDMLNKMNGAFEEFWVWDYGSDFNDYLVPFDTFSNIAEDFKLLSNYKISLYLYQLANSAKNVTGFNSLKLYLLSEFMFDPYQDIEELTNNYFDVCYGEGSEAMKRLYLEYRTLSAYNSVDHGDTPAWNQSIYSQTMVQTQYWKRGALVSWLGYIDEALEATGNDGVLESKTMPAANTAAMYERNIMTDGVFVRYLYACLYLTSTTDENIAFKLKLYNDVGMLDFNHVREESSGLENLYPLATTLGIEKYL